jgi:hypothetical protein
MRLTEEQKNGINKKILKIVASKLTYIIENHGRRSVYTPKLSNTKYRMIYLFVKICIAYNFFLPSIENVTQLKYSQSFSSPALCREKGELFISAGSSLSA